MSSTYKFFSLLIGLFLCFMGAFAGYQVVAQEQTPVPTGEQSLTPTPTAVIKENDKRRIVIAEVSDAEEVVKPSLIVGGNTQMLTLKIVSGEHKDTLVETLLTFPSTQFKSPLKVGDKVLLEVVGDIAPTPRVNLLSKYRQNNLLVWSFMLVGLFILIAGFRSNIKYFQIFLISLVAGLIVLFLYHRNTYLTFGLLFVWLILATMWFAFNVFRKKLPALVLAFSIFGNLILAMLLVFIMKSIDIFDIGLFELFLSTSYEARQVMIYLFSILMIYPLTVVFAEQIISESIKKKKEESDILKMTMIQYISRSAIKNLNTIFLTFFGIFFAIFVGVIAIASKEDLVFQVINSAALSQILSLGFLVLFNLLIFVPLVSFAVGMWLGKLEAHELITDRNVKQLEL